MREPEAIGEARSAMGVELAAYRRAVGYTQAQFAQLTGYSRSTIANVETGRQHVARDFWERADRVLRTGGVLATGYDETETAARHQLRGAARGVSTSRQARTWQLRSGAALDVSTTGKADGDVAPARSTPMSFWPADQEQLSPPLTGTALADLSTASHQLPVPDRPVPGPREIPRPVSLGDIARLASMRQHLKAIDNAHGGGAALPMADGYLRCEVLPLLNGSLGDPASRALITVVAQFQHDVGWMAYDIGEQPLAIQYFHTALRFAHAAGNRLLGGRILAAMSHQAIYLGHLRQAIDFAQAARNITRQVATPRTVAMLAAMEACAHAAAGDARQSWHALGDAAEALPLVVDRSEPEWLDFDEGGYLVTLPGPTGTSAIHARQKSTPRNPLGCAYAITAARGFPGFLATAVVCRYGNGWGVTSSLGMSGRQLVSGRSQQGGGQVEVAQQGPGPLARLAICLARLR